jgi:hypothetical protein
MSNILSEEINKALYLFKYKPGKVISEQVTSDELEESRKIKYTDDELRKIASKYSNSVEFRKNDNSAFQTAYRKGMMDDMFPDRKKNRAITDDDVRQEASKYKTRKSFEIGDSSMYIAALKRGMMDELFPEKFKKYTDDDIKRIGSEYNSSGEFRKQNFKMYYQASIRKLLDDIFPDRKMGRPKSVNIEPETSNKISDYWSSSSTGNDNYKYEN